MRRLLVAARDAVADRRARDRVEDAGPAGEARRGAARYDQAPLVSTARYVSSGWSW
jgi:hypothetical protein